MHIKSIIALHNHYNTTTKRKVQNIFARGIDKRQSVCYSKHVDIDKSLLTGEEYKIARDAWSFFLKAHGDECDMDEAIDTIAEGVLEIAEKHKDIATSRTS